MSTTSPILLVTGASGQLGRLVVDALLKDISPAQVAVAVRDPSKVDDLAGRGVRVLQADYDRPATYDAALAGIGRVLLISSNDLGRRVAQHGHVIAAAKRAGVALLAYTSVLHADHSPLGVAEEHRQTEEALRASGLPFALLRNGWYTENYAAAVPAALAHGTLLGSAGNGRIASASRADYAAAAAAVLRAPDSAGRVYELAGDTAYTLADFAAAVARAAGRPVSYQNLPEADYKAALLGAGLPDALAALVANSDAGAAHGALFDDSHALSRLIGRPTTSMEETVRAALAPTG